MEKVIYAHWVWIGPTLPYNKLKTVKKMIKRLNSIQVIGQASKRYTGCIWWLKLGNNKIDYVPNEYKREYSLHNPMNIYDTLTPDRSLSPRLEINAKSKGPRVDIPVVCINDIQRLLNEIKNWCEGMLQVAAKGSTAAKIAISDYARLLILNNYAGLYVDFDTEFKPLPGHGEEGECISNPVLRHNMFPKGITSHYRGKFIENDYIFVQTSGGLSTLINDIGRPTLLGMNVPKLLGLIDQNISNRATNLKIISSGIAKNQVISPLKLGKTKGFMVNTFENLWKELGFGHFQFFIAKCPQQQVLSQQLATLFTAVTNQKNRYSWRDPGFDVLDQVIALQKSSEGREAFALLVQANRKREEIIALYERIKNISSHKRTNATKELKALIVALYPAIIHYDTRHPLNMTTEEIGDVKHPYPRHL